ncbi:DUF5403 family protein [Janibacter terrae]|uniref:DUF5403 family protein n=1 Tax=Janibacter terrae TaxID=103817 RepID=UPI0031F76727
MVSDKRMHKTLAMMPGVQAAVKENADTVEERAKTLFAQHDRPGGHRIRSRKRGPDRLVYLTGPAPLSLELGHFTRAPASPSGDWTPTRVEGLHIMGRAARV